LGGGGGGGGGAGGSAKLASIVMAWLTVIVHDGFAPADMQAPPHPRKLPPPVAVADSVSCEPCASSSLQSPLCDVPAMVQLIPAPETVPDPVLADPARTVTRGGGGAAKLAATESAWLSVTVHVGFEPDVAHASPHSMNVLPPVASAVRAPRCTAGIHSHTP